jgi:hypothetical protein
MWLLAWMGCFGGGISVDRDTGAVTDVSSDSSSESEFMPDTGQGQLTVGYSLSRGSGPVGCAAAGVEGLTATIGQSEISVPCDDDPIEWLSAPIGDSQISVSGKAASGVRYRGAAVVSVDRDTPSEVTLVLTCEENGVVGGCAD